MSRGVLHTRLVGFPFPGQCLSSVFPSFSPPQVPLSVVLSFYLKSLVAFAGSSRGHAVKTVGSVAVAIPSDLAPEEDVAYLQDVFSLAELPLEKESLSSDPSQSLARARQDRAEKKEDGEREASSPSPVCLVRRADALLNCWGCRHLPQVYRDLKTTRIAVSKKTKKETSEEEEEEVYVALVDVGFAETSIQIVCLREKKKEEEAEKEEEGGERKEKEEEEKRPPQNEVAMTRLAIVVDPDIGTLDVRPVQTSFLPSSSFSSLFVLALPGSSVCARQVFPQLVGSCALSLSLAFLSLLPESRSAAHEERSDRKLSRPNLPAPLLHSEQTCRRLSVSISTNVHAYVCLRVSIPLPRKKKKKAESSALACHPA